MKRLMGMPILLLLLLLASCSSDLAVFKEEKDTIPEIKLK